MENPPVTINAPHLKAGEKIVAARVGKTSYSNASRLWPADNIYYSEADETPHRIAKAFGVDLETLIKINKTHYPMLELHSKLKASTAVELPPRETRWLLARQKRKEKEGKKMKYTVEDIEPTDHFGQEKEFVISKNSIQPYPQLDNTYAKGEIVCALWSEHPEAYRHPCDASIWNTQFYMAVYLEDYQLIGVTDSAGAPMKLARLKFEDDNLNLNHEDPALVRVVPTCVIIKREKEKKSDASEFSTFIPGSVSTAPVAGHKVLSEARHSDSQHQSILCTNCFPHAQARRFQLLESTAKIER